MCFTVQLSMFVFVLRLLPAPCASYHTVFGLSRTFSTFLFFFVSRTSKLFCIVSVATLCILPDVFLFVNTFFIFLFSNQRRRRDLNPRAATNDLLPFQGSPFSHLGTSPDALILLTILFCVNGEGGIRTHAPSRTNGFQDRLVMTTSIPLHN